MKTTSILKIMAATCMVTSLTHADTTWKKSVQATNAGAVAKLPATRFQYELSWKGSIGAGLITFDFNKKDKRYPGYDISQATGKSTGFAYALFPYHFSLTSFSRAKSYKPTLFVANEDDKKAKIDTRNQFTSKGVVHNSTKNYKHGDKPRVLSHTYKIADSHDPLSAIQYIRSQVLRNDQKLNLSLHPFNSPMYAQISVLGREMHAGKRCIKVDVKLYKVDLKTMHLKNYSKLKKATLWISDDADRHMIEMRCDVKVGVISGYVRMTLQSAAKL